MTSQKSSLDKGIIQSAHKYGLVGIIDIPLSVSRTLHTRLVYWMLLKLEARYEDYGDVPRNRVEMRSIFKKVNIQAFSESEDVDRKILHYAREEAWRQFKRWWYEKEYSGGERERIRRVDLFGEAYQSYYREARKHLRLGLDAPERLVDACGQSFDALAEIAQESLCVPWSKDSKLPKPFLDVCHSLGISGKRIYIPRAKEIPLTSKVSRAILNLLEDEYEQKGWSPKSDAELKMFIRDKKLSTRALDGRLIHTARKKAYRLWQDWWLDELKRIEECERIGLSVLLLYRELRQNVRLGKVVSDSVCFTGLSKERMLDLVKNSLDAPWRG